MKRNSLPLVSIHLSKASARKEATGSICAVVMQIPATRHLHGSKAVDESIQIEKERPLNYLNYLRWQYNVTTFK